MVEQIILILIIVYSVLTINFELRQKGEITKLKTELDNLKKYKCINEALHISEKAPINNQIQNLKNQAGMLKFCYLCQLYQDKIQEDRQQMFQGK